MAGKTRSGPPDGRKRWIAPGRHAGRWFQASWHCCSGGRRSPGRCRSRRTQVRPDPRLPHLRPRAPRPPALLPGTGDGLPGPAGHAAHLPGDHLASSLGAARCRLDLRLSLRGQPPAAGARRGPGLAGQAPLSLLPHHRTRPAGDGSSTTCKGDVHAFSDPDSNSGWLVTATALAGKGQTPERFFGQTIFT